MAQIRGKIVHIISSTEVLVNKGSVDGVKKGTKFKIVQEEIVVKDVETQAELGKFIHSKGEIIASEVYEKFCYCNTETIFEWEEQPTPAASSILQPFGHVVRKRSKKTIELDIDLDISDVFSRNHITRVGDEVVEI